MIEIAQLPLNLLVPAWPYVGPLLAAGARVDPDVDLEAAIADVMQERARVWIILEGDMPMAAFLTSVLETTHGRSVDVYGLGGRGLLKWGKHLTDVMTDYAKANNAERVIFKGRKALQRAYPGIRAVGQEPDGTWLYEKRVA